MFQQSGQIRDYIFPLVIAEKNTADNSYAYKSFLGTAFFIGSRGYALTAAHVIESIGKALVVGIFANHGQAGWIAVEVTQVEQHPSEDVAIIKMGVGVAKSFFRLSNSWEGASCKYRSFGYPEDAVYEITDGRMALQRPDLVYTEGYIRRRISWALPQVKGQSFFELSEIAGPGCPGSPVCKFTQPVWDTIGIYVGEKINDRGTSVSYAVRVEAFNNWAPEILGATVKTESEDVTI